MLGISKTISRGHIEKKIMTDIQDSKAAQSWMESICGPHYLRVSNPKLLHFQHIGSVLSSSTTTIGHIKYSTDVTTEIDDLQNSYSISLPLSGFQELEDRNHRVLSNTYNGIIISPETSCALHISGNCQKTLIRISRQSLESALENLIHKPLIAPLVFDPHIDTTQDSLSAWWRTVRYIEQELSSPNALYNNPLFVYEMQQALIKGLLLLQKNNYSTAIQKEVNESLPSYLSKVTEFIQDHAQDDISIEDIEQHAGVSRNKLYADFKKYFGEPPTSYLKRIRLEGTRRDFLKDNSFENISTISMKWGFNHLGRFSLDYKKQFNESPSETLKKIKHNL